MVTGGTGFVGAHSVRALVDAGHQVRLLVRDPSKIERSLTPLGVPPPEHVVGDMTDAGAVREAASGCDAALHCAALLALDRRRAGEVLRANPKGAEIVLGTCVELGMDPVIHVSSISALFRPGVSLIHEDLPPTDWAVGYGRSKALAEEVARRYQAEGAPVVTTYPGTVVGPAAGELLGELADVIALHVRAGVMPLREAAWSVIDVRDLGTIHAALVRPGLGPRRFVAGGNFLTMEGQAQVYRDLTGRRFPILPLPPSALRGVGSAMDLVMRMAPIRSLISAEGMAVLTHWAPTDDHRVHEELRIAYRDPRETFGAALRSLRAAGRLSARHLGLLAAV